MYKWLGTTKEYQISNRNDIFCKIVTVSAFQLLSQHSKISAFHNQLSTHRIEFNAWNLSFVTMHWLFDILANGTASMATFLTNVKYNWFLFRIYKKEYVSVNLLYFLQMRKAKCPKKVMAMKMSKTEHAWLVPKRVLCINR